ncbi:hypothetical protein PG987_009282 [Apiospora arundinis]
MAEYDLMPKLVGHLDRHMIFPLLEFATGQIPEDDDAKAREITKAKYELLKTTNMTDFVGNLKAELEDLDEAPAEFNDMRQKVLTRLSQFEEETSKITDLLGREEVVNNLRSDKVANLEFLKKEHEVTIDNVNALYDFGNFQYSCGNYGAAAELLYQFRVLSTDNDKVAAATWGKLASEILITNWEGAVEEITKVKESIDSKLFNNPLAQLKSRSWLIHWALFPLFNDESSRDTILDLFFSPPFHQHDPDQLPHQKQLKDIVRIVKQEAYEYSDPVTDFVRALYIDFDFEEAQRQLSLADELLRNDFFLFSAADSFLDAARHLISESYCKIHSRIDIKDLSTRLGLDQDEGEKWIVNLIRDTRVDAKIDYKEGTVVMNHPPSSVYQQVIERTKGGFFRTQVLTAAVAR